jgi:hypothetical protein
MPTGEIKANWKKIFVSGTTKLGIGFLLPLIVIQVEKSTF